MNTPAVARQFDDVSQQRHAATLGMWLFIATEILVFSVLFVGYAAARARHPEAFAQAGARLYTWIGVGNAGVLLLSSAAVAFAVRIDEARGRARAGWFFVAVILGGVFLTLKGVEYTLDAHEALIPGVRFDTSRFDDPAAAALFLFFYWTMTALHALHVLAGVIVMMVIVVLLRARERPESLGNTARVVGLYWHMVDVVWLFLLPLLYLNP